MKFTIFKNTKKEKDKQPDYNILGDGFKKIGACWLRESKKGEKFFSCEMEDQTPRGYQGEPEIAEVDFEDKPNYPF